MTKKSTKKKTTKSAPVIQDVVGEVAATKDAKNRPDSPAEAGHKIAVSSGQRQPVED